MFEWMSWSETEFVNKSLVAKPNSTNKILVSNSKCLNESLALKINFQRKVVLLHQNVPTKTFFRIQNVCMKDLHWNQQNSYCETKLAQQKPCFEFKMFEWMSWSETKFLNKSLAAKPNSANKILVSNSKCLNESLALKLKLWRKVLLRNQTPPTKVLFWIENVWMKVLMWNQISQENYCCKIKLHEQNPCFEFLIFEWKSCI